MFSSSATLEKNLWLICSRMPTPSPVLPSASLPARCSSRSTMDSASSTVWWLLRPLMSTTAPMPQASCSNCGSYRPRVVFCSVKFSIVFPILFTCLPGAAAPSAAFYPLQKEKSAPQGHRMPLRNAFVPILDIIQIPEKSSSDSCTKYATHIAPLLVRDAAYGGQLCTHSGQRNDWKCAPRCSAHLQRKEYFYFAFVALCGVLQTLFSQKGLPLAFTTPLP